MKGGDYYLGPADGTTTDHGIQLGSNTALRLDPDAVIIRRYEGSGEEGGATIRNKDQSAGNTNVSVSGGTIKTVSSMNNVGKHLGFAKCTNLTIDDVQITQIFEGWNVYLRDCVSVSLTRLKIKSGTNLTEDGIHITGGSRIVISDCIIESGDDAIALTYESGQTTGYLDTSDVTISNCYLYSHEANALKFVVPSSNEHTIKRVRVSNIVAKVGETVNAGRGLDIRDANGVDRVSDVEIDGLTLDASQNAIEPLLISGVRNCRLANVTILQPDEAAKIDDSHGIELRNVVIDGPRTAGQGCLKIASASSCTDIRILGGRYLDSRQHGITLGSATPSVTGFEVSATQIKGSRLHGLYIINADDGMVVGNSIVGTGTDPGGTDLSYGIAEDPGSDRNVIIGNQLLSNFDGPTYFFGAESEVARNHGDAGKKMPDSGGFRQTVDGFTWNGTIGTNQTTADMVREIGRFRAVRNGSVTGLVLTNTVAANVGGTMTATVYKKTGAAGGSTGESALFSVTLTDGQFRNFETKAANVHTFAAGDELYIKIATSSWSVGGTPFAAFEIED